MTVLLSAQPALNVSDVERASLFYAKLGFTTYYRNQDLHLLIERDGVVIHLATQLLVSPSGCQIITDDVDALYEEACGRNIPMKFPLQDEPWGYRDFTIEDPDGNFVTFSQATG